VLDQAADDLPEGPHLPPASTTSASHCSPASSCTVDGATSTTRNTLSSAHSPRPARGPRAPRRCAAASGSPCWSGTGTLSDALSALEAAVRDGADAGRIHPYLLANLSIAREAAHEHSHTNADLDAAIETYRQACQEGLPAARDRPDHCRPLGGMGRPPGQLDRGRRAAVAGPTGRADQEIWLGAAQGMPDRAGHARARDPQQAVVVLEFGRARLLAEALRDGPDQLEERVPAPAVKYHDAAARFRAAEAAQQVGMTF